MKIAKKMNWVKGLTLVLIIIWAPSMVDAWSSEDILSHFQAYITVQEDYSSNVDLTPNRVKRDEFITTISPGFRFSTAPKSPITGEFQQTRTAEKKYGIDLDFNAGFNFYAKEHDDNYISLNGTLNARYALTQNLDFRVRDYLIRSDDIREQDYSPTAISGQYLPSRTGKRIPWFRNDFEPSVEYRFGRENIVALNYRNNIYRIKSEIGEDSTENYINPRINYWFNIRHGVSFEYGLTLGDFQRSPDLVEHMATGRYTYRFNPRTSFFLNYTQSWFNYEKPGIDNVVYNPSLGIDHAFSPTLRGSLQLGYYWMDPQRGSTVKGPSYNVLLAQTGQKTTYTVSIQGGYTMDLFTAENRGFTQSHNVLGRIDHQLMRNIRVGLFSSYGWTKSPGAVIEDRKPIDQIWAIGGNASYQILRWLTVSLDVSHRENLSNVSDRDYSEYRGMFRIAATY